MSITKTSNIYLNKLNILSKKQKFELTNTVILPRLFWGAVRKFWARHILYFVEFDDIKNTFCYFVINVLFQISLWVRILSFFVSTSKSNFEERTRHFFFFLTKKPFKKQLFGHLIKFWKLNWTENFSTSSHRVNCSFVTLKTL